MNEYRITLHPVYSEPASEVLPGIPLPESWTLSWHQIETYKALQNPEIDVAFNTAMTGDGKSLAAYLPAMTSKNYTMAMYPTNELARDQERQVRNYKAKFSPKYDPQIYRLTGSTLENFVETYQLPSKQQGIIDRADNSEILLTNPDIFYYIHDFRYLRRNFKKPNKGENADKLFRKIDDQYKLFVFDEFHVFSSPQVANILNALLLIKHTSGVKRKFLFLSATPSELLTGFLMRSGLNYKIVNPTEANAYQFSAEEAKGWRQISQPIALNFPSELQPNARSGYNWIVENAEQVILKFFLDYPDSKGAIILNSIASVYRLLGILKPLFERHNLTVLPNTSLTGEGERARSISEADLLIGTSTIDVGVDFRINFLVFEAADAGNFIQRFGRLGRHQGFTTYQAYALIPNFLVTRLFQGHQEKAAPLSDGETCDRVFLTNSIRQAWTFVNQFQGYPKRWGGIQSAFIYDELKKTDYMRKSYPNAAKNFGTDIQKALGVSIKQKFGQIRHCKESGSQDILKEARSFRGSSQLDCAIYDATNPYEPERDRFKTYNLPGLLSNFEIETMEKTGFLAAAKRVGLPTRRFEEYSLCYLRLLGYRDVRENWHFYHAGDVNELARLGKVQVLKGLEVTIGENAISRALYRRGLVCYISDRRRDELRARLGLPMQFQAYELSDRADDRAPPYTIAFGQSALMLETLIWYWKPKVDEGWIC
ncbi:MAG: type I-D CRISPR-associated helicase Cas3' [Cyanobacteriota bacterium]|nr:type I-D CRISPR-associated helicase Cas3' [Cyanobacteriota bacterium]